MYKSLPFSLGRHKMDHTHRFFDAEPVEQLRLFTQ
jgi:hypothetical protein